VLSLLLADPELLSLLVEIFLESIDSDLSLLELLLSLEVLGLAVQSDLLLENIQLLAGFSLDRLLPLAKLGFFCLQMRDLNLEGFHLAFD